MKQYPHKSWERFVNDLYPIIKQIYEENFFQHSNLYCNLKFTMKEESSGELAFFDTLLRRENGNYTVFVYRNQPKINSLTVILIVRQVARKVSSPW